LSIIAKTTEHYQEMAIFSNNMSFGNSNMWIIADWNWNSRSIDLI